MTNNIKKYLENNVSSLVDKELGEEMIANIEDTLDNKYPSDHNITKSDLDDLIKLELLERHVYTEVKAFICL